MTDEPMTVHRIDLRHPDLAFYVDVTLTEHEGRWRATAVLADEPDLGTGQDAPVGREKGLAPRDGP